MLNVTAVAVAGALSVSGGHAVHHRAHHAHHVRHHAAQIVAPVQAPSTPTAPPAPAPAPVQSPPVLTEPGWSHAPAREPTITLPSLPSITVAQGQAAIQQFGHDMTNDGSTVWTASNCTQPSPQQVECDLTQSGFPDPSQVIWSPDVLVTVVATHTLLVWDTHTDNRTPPYTIWQEYQAF